MAAPMGREGKCSISVFTDTPCGLSSHYHFQNDLVKLNECERSIDQHLRTLSICSSDILNEGCLITYRCGLFEVKELSPYTVCPYHRDSKGVYWKKRATCQYPTHSGNAKPYRNVSLTQSKAIMADVGALVPVGAGVCRKCMGEIYSYTTVRSSEPEAQEERPSSQVEQIDLIPTKGYNLRDAMPTSVDTFTNYSEVLSQKSLNSLDSYTDSQISSWSTDNLHEQNDFQNLNNYLHSSSISPVKYKVNTALDDLAESSKRYIKKKAGEVVDAILNAIAPGQAQQLLEMITMKGSHTNEKDGHHNVMDTIIHLYNVTEDNIIRCQLLSLMCRSLSKSDLISRIPGLTTYRIDQARLYATQFETGLQPTETTTYKRMRMDPEKMEHALAFFFNPAFHQIASYGTRELKLESGETLEIPDVVRTACHSTLIGMYQSYCKESGFEPLSRATLFKILSVCSASKRTSLKGLDNISADGHEGFDNLIQLTSKLEGFGKPAIKIKKLISQLNGYRIYLKTEYKSHVSVSSPCADHCRKWALSDPNSNSFREDCNHDHDMFCSMCESWRDTIKDIKKMIEESVFSDEVMTELCEDLSLCINQIEQWKAHILRTINQDEARINIMDNLKPNQALLVLDWAMKFLPAYFREKQSDWFFKFSESNDMQCIDMFHIVCNFFSNMKRVLLLIKLEISI